MISASSIMHVLHQMHFVWLFFQLLITVTESIWDLKWGP